MIEEPNNKPRNWLAICLIVLLLIFVILIGAFLLVKMNIENKQKLTTQVNISSDPNIIVLNWSQKEPPKLPKDHAFAVTVDKKIYVFGLSDKEEASTKLEIYNTETNKWTEGKPLPIKVLFPLVAALNNKIYVLGGVNSITPSKEAISNRVDIYDINSDSWETTNSLKTPRVFGAIGVVGEKIYVIGGLSKESTFSAIPGERQFISDDSIEVFDVNSKVWSTLDSKVPVPVRNAAFATVNNKIYLIGGCKSGKVESTNCGFSGTQIYDPLKNIWEEDSIKLPESRIFSNQGAIALDNKIIVFGGEQLNNNPSPRIDILDLTSKSWKLGSPMINSQEGIAGGIVEGTLYLVGGSGKQNNEFRNIESADITHLR